MICSSVGWANRARVLFDRKCMLWWKNALHITVHSNSPTRSMVGSNLCVQRAFRLIHYGLAANEEISHTYPKSRVHHSKGLSKISLKGIHSSTCNLPDLLVTMPAAGSLIAAIPRRDLHRSKKSDPFWNGPEAFLLRSALYKYIWKELYPYRTWGKSDPTLSGLKDNRTRSKRDPM